MPVYFKLLRALDIQNQGNQAMRSEANVWIQIVVC